MKNYKKILKSNFMKKLLAMLILIPSLSWTSEIEQEVFQSPMLIGEGTLKVLMWEVYDLRLYTDGTAFSWQDKFMLELITVVN